MRPGVPFGRDGSQGAPTHFKPCPSRACLVNQVGREEAVEKPFLDERLATREANEKMVLEPLAYSSDTP
ncbi:hypothetical protein CLV36_11045 [Laceyella sediminis]|uniref:Uncharacterized protein n=1 Tax=Laceyella sediminis TaxID=573074 RepID=A0ABX5EML8_9BACL|nr:hypothetical protein CLV36_11045 [Laceyella sediminis]